jgi:hypothetical protein
VSQTPLDAATLTTTLTEAFRMLRPLTSAGTLTLISPRVLPYSLPLAHTRYLRQQKQDLELQAIEERAAAEIRVQVCVCA